MLSYEEISKALNYAKGAMLTEYLNNLLISGYISKHYSWSLRNGKLSKLSYYSLTDNFLRFYLRYVENKITLIKDGKYTGVAIEALPAWNSILALQFENLVLNNRELLYKALSINPETIIADGPYVQRATKRYKGCQIDCLIQTKYNTLFVCEIKFSQKTITAQVVAQLQEKIKRLSLPRGYAALPVLIHVSDVADEVVEAGYFTNIVDFREFIEG